MFRDLPVGYQIIGLAAVGVSLVITLIVVFFILPDLWRAGRETIAGWLACADADVPDQGASDARVADDGVVRSTRASLDAAVAAGSPLPRLRGLSETLPRVEPEFKRSTRFPGRAAKGFQRRG